MTGRDPALIERIRDGVQERCCIVCREWKPRADWPRVGIRYRPKCRDCQRAYYAARKSRLTYAAR